MGTSEAGRRERPRRVLALDPRRTKIGFAYFCDANLEDWGGRIIRSGLLRDRTDAVSVGKIVRLLEEFQPEAIVLPNTAERSFKRSRFVKAVIRAAANEAWSRQIRVSTVTAGKVRRVFDQVRPGGGRNQQAINAIIAEWFPPLQARLPRKRKLWETERWATPMFTAVALWCAWRGLPVARPDVLVSCR